MTFHLFEQQFAESGGIDAHSVTNFLGKTELGRWEFVLRESLQNSWDARLGDQIIYRVEEDELSVEQTHALRSELLRELPEGSSCQVCRLDSVLRDGRLHVVSISDEGTRGLGGPIRSDVAVGPHGRSDFVDFVRNVGRSKTKGLNGGTYGLGKGVFFESSRLGVCLVYTQTYNRGTVEARLIAMSSGDPDYERSGRRYTGRNWWGVVPPDSNARVDPLVGDQARELALRVGMSIPDSPDSTGTTITILAPCNDSGDRNADVAASMFRAARKWSWPKMLPTGNPAVDFYFSVGGRSLDMGDLYEDQGLRPFIRSLEAAERFLAHGASSSSRWDVRLAELTTVGKTSLGVLAIGFVPPDRTEPWEGMESAIALLRTPRQVVKYMPVQPLADGTRIRGVFIAHPEQDALFAAAEPATHDNWIASQVQARKGARNVVRIALRRIPEQLQTWSLEMMPAKAVGDAAGASRLSAGLGALVTGFSGSGAETQSKRVSGKGHRLGRSVRVAVLTPARLHFEGGHVVARVELSVIGGAAGALYEVSPAYGIRTDTGGMESDPSWFRSLDFRP